MPKLIEAKLLDKILNSEYKGKKIKDLIGGNFYSSLKTFFDFLSMMVKK